MMAEPTNFKEIIKDCQGKYVIVDISHISTIATLFGVLTSYGDCISVLQMDGSNVVVPFNRIVTFMIAKEEDKKQYHERFNDGNRKIIDGIEYHTDHNAHTYWTDR